MVKKTCETVLKIILLVLAYNALWFPHLTTFFSVPFLLIFLPRDIIWCRLIVVVNFYSNATKNVHIIFRWIRNLSRCQNRKVNFFVTPVYLVLCLRSMNWFHDIPITSRCFCVIKKTPLRNLIHLMNAMP